MDRATWWELCTLLTFALSCLSWVWFPFPITRTEGCIGTNECISQRRTCKCCPAAWYRRIFTEAKNFYCVIHQIWWVPAVCYTIKFTLFINRILYWYNRNTHDNRRTEKGEFGFLYNGFLWWLQSNCKQYRRTCSPRHL